MNIYLGKIEIWEILAEIPFSSDRSRMTMVVKNREDVDNTVYVLIKGSDEKILPLLNIDQNLKQETNGIL
jgi:magnesium-transporting ATPase (P-type)